MSIRAPLIHQSALSPSEFEAYLNIVNLLEEQQDDNLHSGNDSIRVPKIYDWIKGFLIEPSERNTELLVSHFSSLQLKVGLTKI